MSKQGQAILFTGDSQAMAEIKAWMETAEKSGANRYNQVREMGEHAILVMYPPDEPPRLDQIRLLANQLEAFICHFETSNLNLFHKGKVEVYP